MKYFAEQEGTYEYPDVQNVFPSLPQHFMHPCIHHDHAVKRMLYPKPKVLMMFRPPLQSFTCPPPPFSVQDDTSQDAPAEQPEEAAERVVVHEALS